MTTDDFYMDQILLALTLLMLQVVSLFFIMRSFTDDREVVICIERIVVEKRLAF